LLQQQLPASSFQLPLARAARHQLWDVCHQLLDTFSYQPTEQDLCTALNYSGAHGEAALMSRLLQCSCQEQHPFCDVCSAVGHALASAAKEGHASVVSLLLSHPSCSAQAVRYAVCGVVNAKQPEVLHMLVSSRPDAASLELNGNPMQAATRYGNVEAMEVLVQHGADVNGSEGSSWRSDGEDSPWRPLLQVAVMHEQFAAAGWLLQHGTSGEGSGLGWALEEAASLADPALMRMLLPYSPTQEVIPSHGTSALLIAVKLGHVAVVEELLKAGVPITAQAIQHTEGLGSEDDVRELLRGCLSRDESYEQPLAILQAAVQHGHAGFAQLLMDELE
jgi:ankyrin repeat protein